jgi:molecular chaperone GrpE
MVEDEMDEAALAHEDAGGRDDRADEERAKLMAENAALKEQALRFAADAENTKRRAERDANDARAYAIQKFARDLLDAADNLARALEHAPKDSAEASVKTLVMGVEMTEQALQSAFERNGLKRIRPEVGARFDPNLHQAMMEQPNGDAPPGSVVQVMQTGYELLGRLVRPAMVVVTPKQPAASAASAAASSTASDGYSTAKSSAGAAVDQKA